jgi:hypothetical protein
MIRSSLVLNFPSSRQTAFDKVVQDYGKEFSELMDSGRKVDEVPQFALLALRGGRCGLAQLHNKREEALGYLEREGDMFTQVRLVDLDTGFEENLERKWIADVVTGGGREL